MAKTFKLTETELANLSSLLGTDGEEEGPDPVQAALTGMAGMMLASQRRVLEGAASFVMDKAAEFIDQRMKRLPPLRIKVGEAPTIEWGEITHPMLPKIIQAMSLGQPVLLVGPAGSGKSYLAAQAAKALSRPFRGYISFTAGSSESALLGRLLPNEEGGFCYWSTPFVDTCTEGGVVCLDELDAGDPNTLLVLNAPLNRDPLWVPNRYSAPIQKMHPDACFVGTANTYGMGASRVYAGRNQLDGAFMDRFTYFEIGYDPRLEELFCPSEELRTKLWDVRAKVEEHKLRRVITGRAFKRYHALHTCAGWSVKECLENLVLPWTLDERKAVGL